MSANQTAERRRALSLPMLQRWGGGGVGGKRCVGLSDTLCPVRDNAARLPATARALAAGLVAAGAWLAVPAAGPAQERPSLVAVRVPRAPVLDGVLDDALWETVPVTSDFRQREPAVGDPATEATRVRV